MILAVDILQVLDSIRSEVVASKLAAFSALASTLAALFAGIVLLRLAHDYVSGQGLTFWELVRPFVIVLVVAQFNTFVASPLHRIVNIGTKGLERQVNISMTSYYVRLGTLCKQTYNNSIDAAKDAAKTHIVEPVEQGKESSNILKRWGSKLASSLGTAAMNTLDALLEFVLYPIKWVINLLYSVAFAVAQFAGMDVKEMEQMAGYPLLCIILLLLVFLLRLITFSLQVECYILLALLTLFGPFAFALSIFNSWRGQLASWIARYISVALWIPIQKILIFISYFLLGHVADLELGFSSTEPWLSLCCIVVTIQMLKKVPEFASYVIDTAVSPSTDALGPAKGLAAAGAKAFKAGIAG